MSNKINRKQLSGKVQSNKMDKTVVVEILRKIPHKFYNKYINRSKKYYVHDPQNSCSIGDIVVIEESRPLSKLKRWRIKSIQNKVNK